jgi:hypothetical protein
VQVATYGPDGKDLAARKKMIQRFFLDGVEPDRTGPLKNIGIEDPIPVLPYLTNAKRTRIDAAFMGTKQTLNFIVTEFLVVNSFHNAHWYYQLKYK